MKYNQQKYISPSQTFMKNNNHFPMSLSHHPDFEYGHRQRYSITYSSLNVNHESNEYIYHQL